MKKIFPVILVLLVLSFIGTQYWPVTVRIGGESPFYIRMPLKDKKRLDYFFRDVCFLNAWAYTLMGSKPMSIHQYTRPSIAVRNTFKQSDLKDVLVQCFWPPHFQKICHLLNPDQLKIKLGWDTLQKYAHYFPKSRFGLYTGFSNDNEIVVLTIVNKINLVKTVRQHIQDFQPALVEQLIEPEDLFDDQKLSLFIKSLQHEGLYGTLLGFGRENAFLFFEYRDQELPMVSAWPEEEIVNLEQLNEKTCSFQPWSLENLFYPRFACDPRSNETHQLKQTYRREREQIIKYYEGKDIVEATLTLFTKPLVTQKSA